MLLTKKSPAGVHGTRASSSPSGFVHKLQRGLSTALPTAAPSCAAPAWVWAWVWRPAS